jgi:hypothetical protein
VCAFFFFGAIFPFSALKVCSGIFFNGITSYPTIVFSQVLSIIPSFPVGEVNIPPSK